MPEDNPHSFDLDKNVHLVGLTEPCKYTSQCDNYFDVQIIILQTVKDPSWSYVKNKENKFTIFWIYVFSLETYFYA